MKPKLNILIIGGDGKIGSAIYKFFTAKNHNVFKTTRRIENVSENTFFLDFKDVKEFYFKHIYFHFIIFCAAETSIKFCEENENESYLINVSSIKKISDMFLHSTFIFLSSDAVFGNKTKTPNFLSKKNPNTIYGLHKHKTEQFFLDKYPSKSIILRMTKVIDQNFYLFREWINDYKMKKNICPFEDYYFAPLYIDYVLLAIDELMELKKVGVHHISPARQISYAKASYILFKKLGFQRDHIKPKSCSSIGLNGKNISLLLNSEYKLNKLNNISVYKSIETFVHKNINLLDIK